MGKLSKQKSLSGGKGWKLVKTVTSPMTHLRNIARAAAFKRADKAGGGRVGYKGGTLVGKYKTRTGGAGGKSGKQ